MSTITLPNIRVSSDLTVGLKLKDDGVAIDWSTLSNIKVSIYADAQRSLAGRCTVAIDETDSTVLVCQYAANKPQYLGVNRVIVQCTYMGETKTYDKPAFTFVRWTDDQEGEEITISDPDVDVEIEVEDVSSSILNQAIAAALQAAEDAEHAAHLIPNQVLLDCEQATSDANAAAAAANAAGITSVQVSVEDNEPGTPSAECSLANKVLSVIFHYLKGETGDAAGFGTITASFVEDGGDPSVLVTTSGPDTAKNIAFTLKNFKGDKGDKGDQGNTGSSVDYPYELVNNCTTDDATKGLSAAQGKALKDELSQLEHKVDNFDKFLWANAVGGINVDTTNRAIIFTENTYIHIGGGQVQIAKNTSASFSSFSSGSLFGLVYDGGVAKVLAWANCIGKLMLASFVLSAGTFRGITFSVLPYKVDGKNIISEDDFVPIYDYQSEQFSINESGYFGTDTKYLHCSIKVNEGDRFILTALATASLRYAFATSDVVVSGGEIPLVSGTSVGVITVNESKKITIPTGCEYLLCYNENNYRPFKIWKYVIDEMSLIDSEITDLKSGNEKLILGDFGNVGASSAGLPSGTNPQRAGMLSTIAVPYKGVTIHFKMPEGYVAGIRRGVNAQTLSGNDYWYRNNDEYTFPDSANFYRIIFAIQPTPGVSTYSNIDASTVEKLLEYGKIAITYKRPDGNAISRNAPSDTRAMAACFLDGYRAGTGIDKYPIFIHTTDIHADAYRLRDACELAVEYNADGLLVTGDVNGYNVQNGFDALESIMLVSKVPVMYCRGNHETYGNSDTSLDVFAKYYAALTSKWSYLASSGVESDKTYYYKDFATKKIRVIALNPYENNITSDNAGAFSQGQIDWFISTLKSTPTDYGILCILHSPEAYPSNYMSIVPLSGNTDFFIDGNPDYWSTPGGLSGTPLKDIVDAFISRGHLSSSFTQTATGGVSETITINGDFTSGINSGVEFIAWVCGHQHLDLIGVYENTVNRQVVLNMTCGICYYGDSSYPYLCNVSDLPRNSIGVTQNAINLYAIDRYNKEIRIARIGADMTASFSKRELMKIKYSL